MKRKIAAILAADVVGYSRLVSHAEEEAIGRLIEYQQVFRDVVEKSEGRIFNTAGDAILAEFSSAVLALRAAIAIQEDIRTRNLQHDPQRRMQFRIGMTVGDVVEQNGDLLGDGVNIAARLEGIAEPGGICLSHIFYEQVINKVPAFYKDLGPRTLKNIPGPVRAYSISLFEIDQLQAIFRKERRHPRWRQAGVASISAAILVVIIGGLIAIYETQGRSASATPSPAPPSSQAAPVPPAPPSPPVQRASAPEQPPQPPPSPETPAAAPTYQDIKNYCKTFTFDDIRRVEMQGLSELARYRTALIKKQTGFNPELNANDAADNLGYGLVFAGFYGSIIEYGPDGWTAENAQLSDVLKEIDRIDAAEKFMDSKFRDPVYTPIVTYVWMLEQGACLFPDPTNPPVNAGLIRGQRSGAKPGQWVGHADMERAPIGALSMSAWIFNQAAVISPVSGSMLSAMAWFCSALTDARRRPTDCLRR